MSDNHHVNPGYLNTLDRLPTDLRRALKDGDWDVLEGARFKSWRRAVHVTEPGVIPMSLAGFPRCVAVDWGLGAPFCAIWMALLPNGLVYCYRELYAADLTAEQQVQAILDAEDEDKRHSSRPLPVILDPSTWARSPHVAVLPGKPSDKNDLPVPGSIARAYYDAFGGQLRKANNTRVAGWALLDEHLRIRPDGLPRILFSTACPNAIRTIPTLPRANTNPEDVDTHSEDHAGDTVRYGLMFLAGGLAPRTTSTAALQHFDSLGSILTRQF